MTLITRRFVLAGLLAAPMIVPSASLMRVRSIVVPEPEELNIYGEFMYRYTRKGLHHALVYEMKRVFNDDQPTQYVDVGYARCLRNMGMPRLLDVPEFNSLEDAHAAFRRHMEDET